MKLSGKNRLLYSYLIKYKGWAFLGGLFMILGVLLLIPTPLLTMHLIDKVIPTGDIYMLSIICIVCVCVLILNGVFSNLQNFFFSKFNHKVVFDIQLDLITLVQSTSTQFRQQKQTGYLMSRIKDDPSRLQSLFADTYTAIVKDAITLLVGCCIIFYLHWKLAIVSIVLLPLFIFTLRKFGIKIKNISNILFELSAHVSKKLQESLALLDTFLVFNAEKFDRIRFLGTQKPYIRTSIKRSIIQTLASSIITTISGLGPLIVLWYGIYEIINGRLTVGQLVAFNSFLGYIFGPTARLVNTFINMQQSLAAWDRVYEMLEQTPISRKESNKQISKQIEGVISFKNVYFDINKTSILKNINFEIKKNQTIGIVGESGGGKSSIVSLISMLNIATKGLVTVDGFDINNVKHYRQQIALVQQEPILFVDSIRNNIKLGKLNATDEEVIEAAKRAKIHDFINSLPDNYNSMVDERGLNMSIGQKQRIAIARCIVRNPAIFIMDEPTANLDAESEKLLMNSLYDFIKSRTTIIIAHRLSSITFADKIIVIDKGIIAEEGTHEQLLNAQKIYASLWLAQNNSINKI